MFEGATFTTPGYPAITQITFLACCAQYPGGSNRCNCRFLPCPCCLPRLTGGSASTTSLSGLPQLHLQCQIACPPIADVCPEATTQPVTRRSRSVATMLIDIYMDGSSSHWRPAPLRRTANGSGKLKRRAEVLSASRRALNGGSATKSKLLIGKRAYSEAEHWPKSLQDLESIVVFFRQILD